MQYTSAYVVGAPNTAAQAGVVAGLQNPGFIEEYRQEYMARAKIITGLLDETPHVTYTEPQSSFFMWINASWYGSPAEVVAYLVNNAYVQVGGSTQPDGTYLRMVYGALKSRADCIDAVKRVRDALIAHPKNKE